MVSFIKSHIDTTVYGYGKMSHPSIEEIAKSEFYRRAKNEPFVFESPHDALLKRLLNHRDLKSSALWYLSEEQAKEFCQMMWDSEKDPTSNTSKEMLLLESLLQRQSFEELFPRKAIHFIDFGIGNGEKAKKIINAGQKFDFIYFPFDASPHMAALGMTNIIESARHGHSIGSFHPDVNILYHGSDIFTLSKDSISRCIRAKKEQTEHVQKRLIEIFTNPIFKKYAERLKEEWDSLPDKEKIRKATEYNKWFVDIADNNLALKAAQRYDSKLQEYLVQNQVNGIAKHHNYCALVHTVTNILAPFTRLELPDIPFDPNICTSPRISEKLSRLETELERTENIFTNQELLHFYRFQKLFSRTTDEMVQASLSSLELATKKPDEHLFKKLYELSCQLYRFKLTELPPEFSSHLVMNQRTGKKTFIPLPRPSDEPRVVLLGNGFVGDFTNFMNNKKVWETLSYLSSVIKGHRVIGLLGQTLGNFSLAERDAFMQKLAGTLEKGDYFMLGVELKPEQNTPVYQSAIEHMVDYYKGGEAFVRKATRLLEIPDSALEYKVHFNEQSNNVEIGFLAKEKFTVRGPGVLSRLFNKVTFQPGEYIPVASSHKFSLTELDDYMKQAGLETIGREVNTTSYTQGGEGYADYAVVMARK